MADAPNTAPLLDRAMAVLVPAALLAALGSGLTVWRELPIVTDSIERMEKAVERFEVRIAALEAVRYQVGSDMLDCQRRVRALEQSQGMGSH